MRITFLCQYFPPEMGAPSARTYEHARHWVSLGHHVTVITGFPNHPTGIIRPEYRGYRIKRENIDGIDVLRTWVYVTPNKGFAKRILNFLSFLVSSLFFGATRTDRPDVVIGTSPQFFSAVSAYLLSVVKGVPFIFEVRDIWPQSAIELGALRNRLAIRILEWIENRLYRKARLIVGVAESTRDYLLAKGIPSHRIAIIPNGVDAEFLSSEPTRAVTMPSELENKFIVSYIGTHGMSHALDVVLRAAKQLESDPEIHFLFVGEGAEKENLLELARKLELRNVTFLPEQPRESLIAFYKSSDVSLVPLRKLPIFSKVLPSKIFELMGTGTAIICSVEGEAANLVKNANAGLTIEPENIQALVAAITQLKTNAELLTRFRQSGHRFVFENYLRSNLAQSYLQSIESAIQIGQKARSGNPMTSES
jgi:Glycosyltransferase